jgi:uncharacterized protein with NAD-binding domain and iron-sulfur cluster
VVENGAHGARTKVAVLGGGAGGLTAAFELTATPELRERYDVTVYQLGWRLGGKGASGRNAAAGQRIEEHGLHIWFGFYDNAFRVMRDAYREWGRPPDTPLATFEDAFHPCDRLVLYDLVGERWHPFRIDMPRNFMRPGDAGELPTFWEIGDQVTRWALGAWRELSGDRAEVDGTRPADGLIPAWFADLAQEVATDLLRLGAWGAEHLLELADRLTTVRARQGDLAAAPQAGQPWFLAKLLTGFRDWVWEAYARHRADRDPQLRQFFTIFDVIASTTAGVVEDGVLERGWDSINDEEWSEWLRRHGAKELTLGRTPAERAPILRAVYDVAFGYPEGDIAKADVAAGTATNDLLRLLFSYRGALMYKMQAGMGDVVFSPLYEVLRQRGVRFHFFTAATRLGLAQREPLVETIEVIPQVDLVGDEYEPLIDVDGLPCWPSEPRWEQLVDGENLRAGGVDFEADLNPLGRDPVTLRRGADFDQVVLGIPIGALEPICGELIERSERWRKAIETAVTVQTQAFQVWLTKPSDQLGWRHGENSVTGCYVEPLDTYCDMSHLLAAESWGEGDDVRGVAYFCGVLDERAGETQAQARERVHANAIEFLDRDAAELWPGAGGAGAGFDWSLLTGARPEPGGEHRFSTQYWRANTSLSERYVLTTAGSIKHRLPSNDSGFDNLKLAGDWTKNGIDGGCVEAAVTSGMQAARAISGLPRTITGQSPRWLQPRPTQQRPFVEYGGRATAPGPFLSLGGRMRSFVLQGDERRIADLVRRTLDEPAGPEVAYRAVGSKVLLMLGGFEYVSSMASPFDRWGAVMEIMASLWVPVVAGRDLGDVFVAERFGVMAPYVLVDNPMSYAGGRELYGYAKTMGRFEPAEGIGDRQAVAAFGGNFGRDEGAAWRTVFEVTTEEDPAEEDRHGLPLEGPASLLAELAPGFLERNAEGEILLPGMKLTAALLDDLMDGKVRQVFLKQFRDASDGTRACYSSVVEAPIEFRRVVMRRARRSWEVRITPLDSHPIDQELGVQSQRPSLVLEGELDMICANGVEIGRVSAPAPATQVVATDAPTVVVAPEGVGVRELVRDAARLVGTELGALRRLKWW